ncbi:hypothetical protein B0H21DRAFT_824600 [Amylocystis lapponica]|nr:hypothetical protein B0H21DRAFT_824600 [Amylocystis lapponica]
MSSRTPSLYSQVLAFSASLGTFSQVPGHAQPGRHICLTPSTCFPIDKILLPLMPSTRTVSIALVVGVLAAFVQLLVRPLVIVLGVLRPVSPLNNHNCTTDAQLQGCEDMVLDERSGLLYLSCSDPSHTTHWLPYWQLFNADAVHSDSYIARYDPATARVTRLEIAGYPRDPARPFAFAFHGIDVVRSAADPAELFVYAVNHRAPPRGAARAGAGADSCVEIFRMRAGADVLTHVATVADAAVVVTPNDVVGAPDGRAFWVMNDHATRTNTLYRALELYLRLPVTFVGYCEVGVGCKVAAGGVLSGNGIARGVGGDADTFLVSSSVGGKVLSFERQADNTLNATGETVIGIALDNVSVDSEGAAWVAAFPKALALQDRAKDVSVLAPSAAFRVSSVHGAGAASGRTLQVEKMFEDDGALVTASTVSVHDVRRGLLYLHSAYSTHLTICRI